MVAGRRAMTARSRRFKFIAKRSSASNVFPFNARYASSLPSTGIYNSDRTISIKRFTKSLAPSLYRKGAEPKIFLRTPVVASATGLFLTLLCRLERTNERFFREAMVLGDRVLSSAFRGTAFFPEIDFLSPS